MKLKVIVHKDNDVKISSKITIEGNDIFVIKSNDESSYSATSVAKAIVKMSQSYALEYIEVDVSSLSSNFSSRIQLLANIYIEHKHFGENVVKIKFNPNHEMSHSDETLQSLFYRYMEVIDSRANIINPDTLPTILENILKEYCIEKEVNFQLIECNSENYPAIHAVGKGSKHIPKLLICEFGNIGEDKKVNSILIGKGVTYDTGGLSIKTPSKYMESMHLDMGGAALAFYSAVLYYLSTKNPIVCITPIVENSISSDSYRPGDIIKSRSGKTIEVLNTDAEGRVILADAVYHGSKEYNCKNIFVMATLTGAANVVVGNDYCVCVTDSEKIENIIKNIKKAVGEYIVCLPDDDIFLSPMTKRKYADIANVSAGYGASSITGHKFIQFFAQNREGRTYTHFDIANYFDNPIHEGISTLNLLEFMKELLFIINNAE